MDTQSIVLVLVFWLERQRFALRVSDVQRVVRAAALDPLPDAAPGVFGMVTVRGHRLPVVSLRSPMGFPERSLDPSQRLIFVHSDRHEAALLVDDVEAVKALSQDMIASAERPAPEFSQVGGIARLETGLFLIEDLSSVLSVLNERAVPAPFNA
jgi:purine-binding chemotaxis protein CheW